MPAGVTARTINWDNINTTTDRVIMPKIVDNIFRSNPLQAKLYKKGTKLDGGAYITQPLIYGEGPGGFFTGSAVLDTSAAEILTSAVFEWKFAYASATMEWADELKNAGASAVAKIVMAKMQTMEKTIRNIMGQGIYSDGTDVASIVGLRAMVSGTGTTYGGISKTTNSWWRSQIDSTTTLATLSMLTMRNLLGLATEDTDTPDMGVTTQAIYDRVYSLFQPQQRFMDSATLKAGFQNILIEGRPLIVDSHCPTGYLFWLNTDYIDFVTHSAANFKRKPWVEPWNQEVRTTRILWAGNLTGSNCRYQAAHTALV